MTDHRKIDVLVAEHVMGFQWRELNGTRCLFNPKKIYNESMFAMGSTGSVPNYSTDISAAWQVVEKMGEGKWFKLTKHMSGTCSVYFGGSGHADAETAQLAICLAALAEKGVKIDE